MIGKNSEAARCQGVSIKKNIILAMLLSGAIAGLAGGIDASAVTHSLTKGVNSGYGFTGIIVAWMSGLNPFVSIVIALFLAALETGSDALQITMHLPSAMGEVLQGLILIPLLAGSIFIDHRIKPARVKGDK
jgi:simple sugar transport system permease protein